MANFVRQSGPTNLTIVPAKVSVETKTEVKQEKPYTNMIPPTVIPNEHTNAYKAVFQQQMDKYNTLTKLNEEISRKRN